MPPAGFEPATPALADEAARKCWGEVSPCRSARLRVRGWTGLRDGGLQLVRVAEWTDGGCQRPPCGHGRLTRVRDVRLLPRRRLDRLLLRQRLLSSPLLHLPGDGWYCRIWLDPIDVSVPVSYMHVSVRGLSQVKATGDNVLSGCLDELHRTRPLHSSNFGRAVRRAD